MDTPSANKAVVEQYVKAFNAGDTATLEKLFALDAQIFGVLGWGKLDFALPIWRMLHESLRLNLTVEAMIAEGDTVACRYTERGTFVAPFRGHQPTGKSYELTAMEWFVLKDGKITRRWGARDAETQGKQIGILAA